MKLLTKEILKKFEKQGKLKGGDQYVLVKFFCPWNQWRWYATEYNPKARLFFGWVSGDFPELGYFSLDELERINGPLGMKIERDKYWDDRTKLSQVTNGDVI